MTAPADAMRTASGALVTVSSTGVKTALPFQYNPETLRRTFEPNTAGGAPEARTQAVRFAAAAAQTISVDCRLSTLHGGVPDPATNGLIPQLAALEMLVYPSTDSVQAARQLMTQGALEILPPVADGLLFVWGQNAVPVRLTSVSVVEELFDYDLNPIQATVSLTMRVLTYSDVDPTNPAYQQFFQWQQGMELLAKGATLASGGSS